MRQLALVLAFAACGGSNKTSSATPDAPGSGSGSGSASTMGCDGASLLADPNDFAAPGPWPVGVKTVMVGNLLTEVWYPATPGSEAGKAMETYDIRKELSATEAAKIPDADNPVQPCDCVRDLPLDGARGKYPVVLFVHGTASFRHQSLHFVTHWASRGFVVVAADHPGLKLGDLLAMACGGTSPPQNLSGDLDALIAAIGAPSGDLAFLAGHIDTTRVAVSGHSAGGGAAAAAAGKPGVQVVIPMAGAGTTPAVATLKSGLYFGGLSDGIASWNTVKNAYDNSPKPRRLVGLKNAGHLNFSDLCDIKNAAGQDILTVAKNHGICGANLAGFLFDCDPSHLDGPTGWSIVNYASSAVLESTLQCKPMPDLKAHEMGDSNVGEYDEAL